MFEKEEILPFSSPLTESSMARIRRSFSSILMTLFALFWVGCGYFFSGEPEPAAEKSASSEQTTVEKVAPVSGQSTGFQILWQIPTEPVETYHLAIIDDAGNEIRKIKIAVSDLAKFDHPTFGPVYRYELRLPQRDAHFSVTLRAENHFGISDPSAPYVLETK